MSMRITEMMKFNTMNTNLSAVQNDYAALIEKMATQKTIRKPSDDPLGIGLVLNYRAHKTSVQSYQRNIESAGAWIEMSESKLNSVNDILVKVRELALSQSTATATAETRNYTAQSVAQLVEELRSLANSRFGDRYLFSGTKTRTKPFVASGYSESRLSEPRQGAGNSFSGKLEASGTYTGDFNRTYVVKIVGNSPVSGSYAYQVSEDGGTTWAPEIFDDLTLNVPIGLKDQGVQLTMKEMITAPAAGDIFYIDAIAAGYYEGNGEELALEIGEGISFDYSVSGESVFTESSRGDVDIFKTLSYLETALRDNDPEKIGAELSSLEKASIQVNRNIAKCGTRMNRLDVAGQNLTNLDLRLTELISNKEDVDIAKLVTEFSMKEIVLKASYQMASKIGNMTLLDFLK
ncbi:MAG: flagellar hook-associated protein FlgL [Syntrophales bacterium]|jgi:flagellar hook-associated protein 3 FlgL|nr:flagellar hook-associated protein FlgL [Syntrophales bacterium]MDY0043349.1 flagellar hook-associated protein FlgL [Syntrophales bacterium]